MFDGKDLENHLGTKWAGRSLLSFDRLDSTNIRAKQEAENGASEGTLVIADMQTAGRGRRGRSWNSPAGCNLYFTLILRPCCAPDKASGVTLLMALAVAESIRAGCGVEAQIKWPNDIVVNGRKVCGILTEMSAEPGKIHYVVIGVGINVGLQEFPPELTDTAASLQAECGREVSKALLLADSMRAFEKYYDGFQRSADLSGIWEKYNSLLVNRDREVRVLDPKGEFCGVARGINEKGDLLVEREDGGLAEVYAGEVSVRGIYGYTV